MKRDPRRWFLALYLAPSLALAAWLALDLGWQPLAAWWVACNVLALPLWAYDKWQAPRAGWRVPEATLHAAAVLGAAPSSLLAVSLLRHKTRKPWFRRLYAALTVLQGVAFACWWFS